MRKTLEEMQSFDIASLVPILLEKYPDCEWIKSQLKNSNIVKWQSAAYCYLVEPSDQPNTKGSTWQFKHNLDISHPDFWIVVIDVLKGNKIGGIEFVGNI